MDCDICDRKFNARRTPFCASCTRARLYSPRIEQAAALLGREKSHTHVEAVVRPGNDGVLAALPEDADWDAITAGISSHSLERTKAEKEATENRIRDVTEKAEQLRRQIDEYKAFAAKQKESIEHRRNNLSTQRAKVERQELQKLEPGQPAIRKAKHRLNKVHTRTAEAREYLCKEVSALSGLKKVKTADGKTQYWLSGVPLPQLKDLNGINGRIKIESEDLNCLAGPHEVISASMDNLCRFLGICCHYLSIQPPAEIILPHNDFPHAAIVPIGSSYKTNNPRYPGLGSNQPTPEASRIILRSDLSRPRLLQLDRPLPQLQKEDPKAAALFIEGVSLLAYNLTWLCRTQGFGSSISFEDVCDLGRNLHQLFPGRDNKSRPPLGRNFSSATARTERSTADVADTTLRIGSYSHGSSRHSLAGHEAEARFSDFKLSVTKLTDQLKSYLRNETARAEWHIIEDTEWDEELEDERPVFVGGERRSLDTKGPAMSVMTVAPNDGNDEATTTATAKGKSGWTKVRGRIGET